MTEDIKHRKLKKKICLDFDDTNNVKYSLAFTINKASNDYQNLSKKGEFDVRETDRIANELFNGNVAMAINYIIRELGTEEQGNICEEWDKNELEIAADVLANIAIERHGVRGVIRILRESERQVKHETRLLNPYLSLVLIDLFKLVIINGCIIVVCLILQHLGLNIDFRNWAIVITGGYTTLVAIELGPKLINYFKRNKEINKEIEKSLKQDKKID